MLGFASLYVLILLGLGLSTSALVLRQAQHRHPDPNDIQDTTGLAHMLTGTFAGLAFLSICVAAVFATGILLPVAAAMILYLVTNRRGGPSALRRFYPFQIALAVAALLVALVLWLNVLVLNQGDTYV